MTTFIQLHILTPYAAANLNRDDTGRPKTLTFGGAERLRISSQSLKRAFRTSDVFAKPIPGALGKRSIGFMDGLIAVLKERGLDEETAIARASSVITQDKMGKLKADKSGKTEQLVHLGPDELAEIINLADSLAAGDLTEKGVLVLKHKPRAADIAMFGRMLADNPGFNVEAAVQVAHAFTTHRVSVEDDYYTAVDDIKGEDADANKGAGFIGVQEYGAGLFYLYICINADQLVNNLAGDKTLAANAVEGLIRAATTVSPTGKQNAFASRSRANYVLQEIGDETPRALAAAFQKPVGVHQENDYFEASVKALEKLKKGFAESYGEQLDSLSLNVHEEGGASLTDLIAKAKAAVEAI